MDSIFGGHDGVFRGRAILDEKGSQISINSDRFISGTPFKCCTFAEPSVFWRIFFPVYNIFPWKNMKWFKWNCQWHSDDPQFYWFCEGILSTSLKVLQSFFKSSDMCRETTLCNFNISGSSWLQSLSLKIIFLPSVSSVGQGPALSRLPN